MSPKNGQYSQKRKTPQSETGSPALYELAHWLRRNEAELLSQDGRELRLSLSAEARTEVLSYLPVPARQGIDRLLQEPTWEELLESRDPALLQQASWVADQARRPFLAQDLAILAEIVAENSDGSLPAHLRVRNGCSG